MKKILIVVLGLFLLGASYTPQPVTKTGLDGTWQTACEMSLNGKFTNYTFEIKNTGANPFTDCQIQSYVGPTATDWALVSDTWVACDALAAGSSSGWALGGGSFRKLRLQVKATAGTNSYCQMTANGPK